MAPPALPEVGMSSSNPITTEVIRNAFLSAAEQMNASLVRSAYSPIIYEAKDCSVALFDERGEALAQASGLAVFLGNLGMCIEVTAAKYGWEGFQEGDVYVLNDPYTMGSHLGDFTIFSPVFYERELVGFAATIAHWIDIGAKDRVLPVDSTEIYQEGIRLGPTRLMQGGQLVQDVVDILAINSRLPDFILGDMHAQIAACRMGERRYQAILDKFGLETVRAAVEVYFAQAEQLDREVIGRIPDGEYFAEGCLDNDGQSDDPVWIRVRVAVQGTEMTVDLTGTDPQVKGCINCGYGMTISASRVAYKMLINPRAAVTGGTFRALHVEVPEGCFLRAQEPAACQFYFSPLGLLIDLVIKALAEVLPEQVAAAHYGDSMMLYVIGQDFIHLDGHTGGWGGSYQSDGESALQQAVGGDMRNFPVELTEQKFPVQFRRFGFVPDSGGPGRHRGGLGTVRELEVQADDVVLSLWFERSKTRAWGLFGGQPGHISKMVVNPESAEAATYIKLNRLPAPRGTVTSALAGGGGGYGDPLRRDPELVREDVIDGYVSREHARIDYGIIFKDGSIEVDQSSSADERSNRAQTQ